MTDVPWKDKISNHAQIDGIVDNIKSQSPSAGTKI